MCLELAFNGTCQQRKKHKLRIEIVPIRIVSFISRHLRLSILFLNLPPFCLKIACPIPSHYSSVRHRTESKKSRGQKKCPAIPVISPLDFFVEKKAVQIVAFLIAAVA